MILFVITPSIVCVLSWLNEIMGGYKVVERRKKERGREDHKQLLPHSTQFNPLLTGLKYYCRERNGHPRAYALHRKQGSSSGKWKSLRSCKRRFHYCSAKPFQTWEIYFVAKRRTKIHERRSSYHFEIQITRTYVSLLREPLLLEFLQVNAV